MRLLGLMRCEVLEELHALGHGGGGGVYDRWLGGYRLGIV
jgi:hypothetical protein